MTQKYWNLRNSVYEDKGIVKEPKDQSFMTGQKITKELPHLIFETDQTKKDQFLDLMATTIPVMSDYLISVLKDAGINNLQLFDATVKNPQTQESWDNYKAVNIVGIYDVADIKKSEGTPIGLGIVDFTNLVLDPAKLPEEEIFRVKESADVILITDRIKEAIMKANPIPHGLQFNQLDQL